MKSINRIIFLSLILSLLLLGPLFAQEKPDALRLYWDKQYKEAAAACINEIKETPQRMDSYAVLGWSLLALKNYQDALNWSLRGLRYNAYDTRLVLTAAESSYALGHYQKALGYFEDFIAKSPQTQDGKVPQVYYYMGEIYLKLNEYNHADMAFSTAVHFNPNASYWWYRLGLARERAKNFPLASQAYAQSVKLNPKLKAAAEALARVEKSSQS